MPYGLSPIVRALLSSVTTHCALLHAQHTQRLSGRGMNKVLQKSGSLNAMHGHSIRSSFSSPLNILLHTRPRLSQVSASDETEGGVGAPGTLTCRVNPQEIDYVVYVLAQKKNDYLPTADESLLVVSMRHIDSAVQR